MRKILIPVLLLGAAIQLGAGTWSDQAVYMQLTSKGPDAVAAVDTVLAHSDSSGPIVLFYASGKSLQLGHLSDAAFLFYVARLRVQFDATLFPPSQTGGDSPMTLLGALQDELGQAISPRVWDDPKALDNALARLRVWKPRVSETYDPGWPYQKPGELVTAQKLVEGRKAEFLKGMDPICTLLHNGNYLKAVRTARNYRIKSGSDKPSKAEFDAAVAVMKDIEKSKNLQGLSAFIHG